MPYSFDLAPPHSVAHSVFVMNIRSLLCCFFPIFEVQLSSEFDRGRSRLGFRWKLRDSLRILKVWILNALRNNALLPGMWKRLLGADIAAGDSAARRQPPVFLIDLQPQFDRPNFAAIFKEINCNLSLSL